MQHRPVRSFILRQGRLSGAQRRACETLLPKFGILFSSGLINLDQVFGRQAPRILEIGSGMGNTTVHIAQSQPQNDYLAVEVHTPGVGSLLRQVEASGLTNVRIIQHDAVEVLQHMLPVSSIDGVHIFFPDPWPKVRHHKRRLIKPDFIALLCSRLRSGGYIHVATDWENYAQQILDVLGSEPQLVMRATESVACHTRPLTRFEQRGLRLGYTVRDMIFCKK